MSNYAHYPRWSTGRSLVPLCGTPVNTRLDDWTWTIYPEDIRKKRWFLDHTQFPEIKRCETCILLLTTSLLLFL